MTQRLYVLFPWLQIIKTPQIPLGVSCEEIIVYFVNDWSIVFKCIWNCLQRNGVWDRSHRLSKRDKVWAFWLEPACEMVMKTLTKEGPWVLRISCSCTDISLSWKTLSNLQRIAVKNRVCWKRKNHFLSSKEWQHRSFLELIKKKC